MTVTDRIDQVADEVRDLLSARPAPDLTGAVMSQIGNLEPLPAAPQPGLFGRLATWLWMPREVSIRPAYAFGAAAMVALLFVIPVGRGEVTSPVLDLADEAVDAQVFVQFRLDAPASRVQLAGSFTNWEPRYELRESAPGIWTITVPLTEGVHDYAFVLDGRRWVADPHAPQIGDGFGGTNSRLALLPPEPPQL